MIGRAQGLYVSCVQAKGKVAAAKPKALPQKKAALKPAPAKSASGAARRAQVHQFCNSLRVSYVPRSHRAYLGALANTCND